MILRQYKQLLAATKSWLCSSHTHNVFKALVSCTLATLLLLITPVRQALGPYGFNALIVAGWTHGGTTIGAHIELQAQQLIVSTCVWAYMAGSQLIIFGVANIPGVDIETSVYAVRSVLLSVFCFLVALVYAYAPRLSVPVKLNVIAPLSALTIFPAKSSLAFPTMPSIIYSQLLGIGISMIVNLLVLPSTSSRQLAECLEVLALQMTACCDLARSHINELAFALHGCAPERAAQMRRSTRAAATQLAETTGSVRFEVLIGVFSQSDYQAIFVEANKAAASFGALCLPFEIDRQFVSELYMGKKSVLGAASPAWSGVSGTVEFENEDTDPSDKTVKAICNLLQVHREAVARMAEELALVHGRSATQEICSIACRWLGISSFQIAGSDSCRQPANKVPGLLDIANNLDTQAKQLETIVTMSVEQIPSRQILCNDSWYMHHTILLSFAGVLRENSIRISRLLRTIGKIQSKRQGVSRVWVPRLSWAWLVRGSEDLKNQEFRPLDLENEQPSDNLQTAFEKSRSMDDTGAIFAMATTDTSTRQTGSSSRFGIRGAKRQIMQLLVSVDALLHKRKVQYAFKFSLTTMLCAIWAFLSFSHDFYVQNNCHWGLICITFVFNISVGATASACIKRLLATCLAGAWAVAAWELSLKGTSPYLAFLGTMVLCGACIGAQFYAGSSGLAPIAPVMLIAYAAVFCTAYYEKNEVVGDSSYISGERLGWQRIVVNTIGIAFAMTVSAVLMPYRARVVLQERLAELLRYSSRISQTTTLMNEAGYDHPAEYQCEQARLVHYLQKSRVLVARSRALHVVAKTEPGLPPTSNKGGSATSACKHLIDALETQLEWQMYSFSTYEHIGQSTMTQAVRASLAVRQDILGATTCFNYIMASALTLNQALPMYLPDIRTARLQSLGMVRQALHDAPGFDATALCRLSVGVWHLAAGQSTIQRLVRDVVGSEADLMPDMVDRMAEMMESGGTAVETPLLATFDQTVAQTPMQWFAHQHRARPKKENQQI